MCVCGCVSCWCDVWFGLVFCFSLLLVVANRLPSHTHPHVFPIPPCTQILQLPTAESRRGDRQAARVERQPVHRRAHPCRRGNFQCVQQSERDGDDGAICHRISPHGNDVCILRDERLLSTVLRHQVSAHAARFSSTTCGSNRVIVVQYFLIRREDSTLSAGGHCVAR